MLLKVRNNLNVVCLSRGGCSRQSRTSKRYRSGGSNSDVLMTPSTPVATVVSADGVVQSVVNRLVEFLFSFLGESITFHLSFLHM